MGYLLKAHSREYIWMKEYKTRQEMWRKYRNNPSQGRWLHKRKDRSKAQGSASP